MSDPKPRGRPQPRQRPLPILLLRARAAVAACFKPVLRDHDLTEQQWRVLRALWGAGHLDVLQLSVRTDLLPSSLSRILRDLTERNLLVRTVPESDGRRVLTHLTGAGRKLVEDVMNDIKPVYADIERRLGSKLARELEAMLEEVIEALETKLPLDGD
jgi:homoprotocatechuate degradation regulator HpaR